MKVAYEQSIKYKVLEAIKQQTGNVIIREDLKDIAAPRQISRALKALMTDGEIARISRGIYAKAEISPYVNSPIISGGFEIACFEALDRLNIKWELGQLIKDYNEGRSQQVPMRMHIRLKNRFRRRFVFGKSRLVFDGDINAK